MLELGSKGRSQGFRVEQGSECCTDHSAICLRNVGILRGMLWSSSGSSIKTAGGEIEVRLLLGGSGERWS